MNRSVLAHIIFFTFLFNAALAQDRIANFDGIRGRVVDIKGMPIPGAQVYFRKTGTYTNTDSTGYFHFRPGVIYDRDSVELEFVHPNYIQTKYKNFARYFPYFVRILLDTNQVQFLAREYKKWYNPHKPKPKPKPKLWACCCGYYVVRTHTGIPFGQSFPFVPYPSPIIQHPKASTQNWVTIYGPYRPIYPRWVSWKANNQFTNIY